ncbi:hypothetical protein NQ318_008630 [Aromia moschata]|uniref:Uncharacterized protein n=1 Tax=Aromia moschata TaxID=1265417 RepID=A0AAV8YW58_9CUCU|nr:hypothetical protein NQ318_008630 [Aromia moschata]
MILTFQITHSGFSKAEHPRIMRAQFGGRYSRSSLRGMEIKKIYCLEVLNLDGDNSTRGTALVKEGGVGHTFVTVEMHSQRSHGMEFDIQIYGN